MRWTPPEGYATIPEAAERLGCSTITVRKLIRSNELESIQVDGLYGPEHFIKMEDKGQEQVEQAAAVAPPVRPFSFERSNRPITKAVLHNDVKSCFSLDDLSANVSEMRKKMEFTPEPLPEAPPKKAFFSRLMGK